MARKARELFTPKSNDVGATVEFRNEDWDQTITGTVWAKAANASVWVTTDELGHMLLVKLATRNTPSHVVPAPVYPHGDPIKLADHLMASGPMIATHVADNGRSAVRHLMHHAGDCTAHDKPLAYSVPSKGDTIDYLLGKVPAPCWSPVLHTCITAPETLTTV